MPNFLDFGDQPINRDETAHSSLEPGFRTFD